MERGDGNRLDGGGGEAGKFIVDSIDFVIGKEAKPLAEIQEG